MPRWTGSDVARPDCVSVKTKACRFVFRWRRSPLPAVMPPRWSRSAVARRTQCEGSARHGKSADSPPSSPPDGKALGPALKDVQAVFGAAQLAIGPPTTTAPSRSEGTPSRLTYDSRSIPRCRRRCARSNDAVVTLDTEVTPEQAEAADVVRSPERAAEDLVVTDRIDVRSTWRPTRSPPPSCSPELYR